ncbi:UDP-N-acetylglucosamine 1-carboxyvinyltransferase [PVC group bacterium (ex Bugula neritina AB1)]|nr:UDP-N-acetylglucosamine 1-carboxyvinyltransferase [PVC group bacterium (ex Bugula neritina AB1)]
MSEILRIQGGSSLNGEVKVSGSKNASLPILAATILCEGTCSLHNIPDLSDVQTMIALLRHLGSDVSFSDNKVLARVRDNEQVEPFSGLVSQMRASICLLGPLLAKRKSAQIAFPGGCVIGDRPIDLHLKGLKALGAKVDIYKGYLSVKCDILKGVYVDLKGPFGSSVLATANILMAATMAKGETIISSAACEPEIVDLCHFLNRMGANISGIGKSVLKIEGVESLEGKTYEVIPDRIEAGTFLLAGIVTQGNIRVSKVNPSHMKAVISLLQKLGQKVYVKSDEIEVQGKFPILPTACEMLPYPAFPTDLQPQLMLALCLSKGISIIEEKVYPERFSHVAELQKFGGDIYRKNAKCFIRGKKTLQGAEVQASDLRAGAALILGGLVAEKETFVSSMQHVYRGYEKIENKLRKLGACVESLPETVAV